MFCIHRKVPIKKVYKRYLYIINEMLSIYILQTKEKEHINGKKQKKEGQRE